VPTQSFLTPAAFVEKWRGVTTTEKASSQSHFIDLCPPLLIVSDIGDSLVVISDFGEGVSATAYYSSRLLVARTFRWLP